MKFPSEMTNAELASILEDAPESKEIILETDHLADAALRLRGTPDSKPEIWILDRSDNRVYPYVEGMVVVPVDDIGCILQIIEVRVVG